MGHFQLLQDCQLEIITTPSDDIQAIPEVDIPAASQVKIENAVPVPRSNRARQPPPHYYKSPSSGSSSSHGGMHPVFASDHTVASAQKEVVFRKAKDEQLIKDGVNSLLRCNFPVVDDIIFLFSLLLVLSSEIQVMRHL